MRTVMDWTDREKVFLRENAPNMTVKELAAALEPFSPRERSVENVRLQCKRLDVEPKSEGRHQWSKKEEAYLLKYHDKKTAKAIGKKLGIPTKAVAAKKHKMTHRTLGRMKRVTPWTRSMLFIVEELGESIYEVAYDLWQAGKTVEIEENDDGLLAVFCREGN
jgi:hypothetical protein